MGGEVAPHRLSRSSTLFFTKLKTIPTGNLYQACNFHHVWRALQ